MIHEDLTAIKIIDIGEADYSKKDERVELEGVGTPSFAAPELIELMLQEEDSPNKKYGNYIKCDVYSLAMTLIYFIYPKKIKQSFFLEYFNKVIKKDYAILSSVIDQMIRENQDKRPDFEALNILCREQLGDKVNLRLEID